MNITPTSKTRQEIEAAQSQLIAAKAAQAELVKLHDAGVLSKSMYEEMRADYQIKVAEAEAQLRYLNGRHIRSQDPSHGRTVKLNAIKRQLLMVERSALNDAVRKRIISAEIASPCLETIDNQLLSLED